MPLSREEIMLLTEYEQELTALRRLMADGLYWGCRRSLERYQAFMAEFGEGGRYASLAEQYGADSQAINAEDIASLVGGDAVHHGDDGGGGAASAGVVGDSGGGVRG